MFEPLLPRRKLGLTIFVSLAGVLLLLYAVGLITVYYDL
jgi:hypothetical protein